MSWSEVTYHFLIRNYPKVYLNLGVFYSFDPKSSMTARIASNLNPRRWSAAKAFFLNSMVGRFFQEDFLLRKVLIWFISVSLSEKFSLITWLMISFWIPFLRSSYFMAVGPLSLERRLSVNNLAKRWSLRSPSLRSFSMTSSTSNDSFVSEDSLSLTSLIDRSLMDKRLMARRRSFWWSTLLFHYLVLIGWGDTNADFIGVLSFRHDFFLYLL